MSEYIIESIERMRKLINDNLVMGLRFQMNRELNELEREIEQELNSRAERTCELTFDGTDGNFGCSECLENIPPLSNYCPSCGAKVLRNTPKCSETTTKAVGE